MRTRIAVVFIFLFTILALSQSVSLAQTSLNRFDVGLEREIGYFNYRQVLATTQPWRPVDIERRQVERVFERIIRQSPRKNEVNFTLNFVNDPTVNAFALPDGHVFVNSGLVEFVQNDGELAGVLAHEISHVDRRHGMKAIYRSVGMSLVINLAFNKGDRDQRARFQSLANITAGLAQLGYSRDAEFEADRYGVLLMEQAGYDKNDLLRFWKRVQNHSGEGNWDAVFKVLSTHPPVAERIGRIEGMK